MTVNKPSDFVVPLVVGVLFVGLLVFLGLFTSLLVRLARRRRAARTPLDDSGLLAAAPEVRIVSLGLPGSGKTLLLASMFRCFKTSTPQRRYFLTADYQQTQILNGCYEVLAHSADWPAGTRPNELRDFTFTVQTDLGRGAEAERYPVLHLKYLEYAGELLTLTSMESAHLQGLLDAVKNAHALLGVLDGRCVLRVLKGDQAAGIELTRTLNVLIDRMWEARCPISFVITKWDLLVGPAVDENVRLAEVRDLLMRDAQLRNLVQHDPTRSVRLIPVSAVGPGFAALDAQGHVLKRHGAGLPNPVNVDIPFSTVVPDVLDSSFKQLTRDQRSRLREELRAWRKLGPVEWLATVTNMAKGLMPSAVTSFVAVPGSETMAGGLAGLFFDSANDMTALRKQIQSEEGAARRRFREFQQARTDVVANMRERVIDLEERFPATRMPTQ